MVIIPPRTFAAALVAIAGCAPRPSAERDQTRVIEFTATPSGLLASQRTGAGFTTLVFRNETDSLMAHEVVRLNDDVSADSGLRAMRVFHGIDAGDRAAALSGVDRFFGGAVFVAPHTSKSVSTVLPKGRYVSYADVVGNGPPRVHAGFIAGVEIGGGDTRDSLPKADHTIRMIDNAFQSPREVKAGRARWHIENAGTAVHLAFIARVLPGHSAEEAARAIANPEGPPPVVDDDSKTLGVHALSSGTFNDVELDLVAGEYVIVCFIAGHHTMGMVSPLKVTP